MAKKGYAYKKAIQLIAYDRGLAGLPSIPKSPSMRGAIQSWKKKIEKGYRPKSKETKQVFNFESRKVKSLVNERPFLRVQGQIHSKRPINDIRDVVFGFYIAEGEPYKYEGLKDFDEENLEELFEVADKLGKNNNPDDWNKEFKKLGLDVEVWTLPYIVKDFLE